MNYSKMGRCAILIFLGFIFSFSYGHYDSFGLGIEPEETATKTLSQVTVVDGKGEKSELKLEDLTMKPYLKSTYLNFDHEIALIQRSGNITYDTPENIVQWSINPSGLQYETSSGILLEGIVGVIENPPTLTIAQTFYDAMNALENQEPVLILEIDGLGYTILKYARGKGSAPFLSMLEVNKALSGYRPVSTVGLATILTGRHDHGIVDRQGKEPAYPDLFQKAKELGKKSVYIEGTMALIKTSVKPILSIENSGDDRGVYENTVKALETNPDLTYSHFHTVDDMASEAGPYSDATLEQIRKVDGMVKTLVQSFHGQVIIISDHGLHNTKSGGVHGSICLEDMEAIYITMKGGANE